MDSTLADKVPFVFSVLEDDSHWFDARHSHPCED